MTHQKLNSEAIAGIQEIDDAVAANYNGGADMTLYQYEEFGGSSRDFNGSVSNLENYSFHNVASSIKITEGTWQFFLGTNYTGESVTLVAPKETRRLVGVLDNNISSFKRIA